MISHVLRHGDGEAVVDTLGAELRSWSVQGRALLWQADARWWAQTCPVLFPVCGWLQDGVIRVDGRTYALGLHGFAAQSVFTVMDAGLDHISLELRDGPRTRAVFPFGFRLQIDYQLGEAGLDVRFTVDNTGDRVLPYGLGLHPGFAWPFDGGERDMYTLEFEQPERGRVPLHENGLITTRERSIPLQGRILPLTDALFEPGGLNMRGAASRQVAFRAPSGAAISLALRDLPNIVIWTRPGAPFLCVEGWCATNDPVGFAGDITEKPGMRLLPPGMQASHSVTMAFQPRRGAGPMPGFTSDAH